MPVDERQPEFRDFLSVLWVRKWWIIGSLVGVTALLMVNTLRQPKLYTSVSEVLVQAVSVPTAGYSNSAFVFMETELQIAGSAAVANIAGESLADQGFPLVAASVSNTPDTQTILFKARGSSPEVAQAGAQAYAEAYLAFRRDQLLSNIDGTLRSIESLLTTLEEDLDTASRRLANSSSEAEQQGLTLRIASLSSQIEEQQRRRNELEIASKTPVGQILQPATLPFGPSSPRPRRSLALGLFMGLVIGVGLAFLRDRMDQRLRGRKDIEAVAGAPVLGQIPRVPSLHRRLAVTTHGDPLAAESFRSLRTRLLFSASKNPLRTVLITSAAMGDGKTTTAVNLAVALAQADKRVALVSADLRRPGMARYFPEKSTEGLADALAGVVDLKDVVVRTAHDNLMLVPAGSLHLTPEAALGSTLMMEFLETLAGMADIVLVDSPPIIGVSDALDLASLVDGVILVVDTAETRKDAVEEAVGDLRSVGGNLLGLVLTRWEPGRFSPYQKGYGYGYGGYLKRRPAGAVTSSLEDLDARDGTDGPRSRSRLLPSRGDARAGSRSGHRGGG